MIVVILCPKKFDQMVFVQIMLNRLTAKLDRSKLLIHTRKECGAVQDWCTRELLTYKNFQPDEDDSALLDGAAAIIVMVPGKEHKDVLKLAEQRGIKIRKVEPKEAK